MSLKLVIFDMDGVITDSALVHAGAWKQVFDRFLEEHGKTSGRKLEAFDIERDYYRYVDGNPRYVGIKNFLKSRDILLEQGSESDTGVQTVCGIGNTKDAIFLKRVNDEGVVVFQDTLRLIKDVFEAPGVLSAVASSSKNCRLLLEKAGLTQFFDVVYDGMTIKEKGLSGKPHPDVFTSLMEELEIGALDTVIIEDAISGVQAARASGARLVLGLERKHGGLSSHGADVVLPNLSGVNLLKVQQWFDEASTRS